MTHAYDSESLEPAMNSLGEMLEYAELDVGIPAAEFYQWFLVSGFADRFGRGETAIVNGMSGIELAREVIFRTTKEEIAIPPSIHIDKESVYWAGWAVAYYEWSSAIPFRIIEEVVPFKSIQGMYHPYHEMDITQFADEMDSKMSKANAARRLGRLRRYAELTQRELAERSGISIRTIQQYEQGQKDVRKAAADTVMRLSAALYCRPSDLSIRIGNPEELAR